MSLVLLAGSPYLGWAFVDQFVGWMRGQLSSSTSYGLVIGINSYANTTDLNYAVNDAQTMAKVLKELGFQVPPENVLLKAKPDDPHVTKGHIRDAIFRVLQQAKSTDRVLIFYAGHGKEVPYYSGTEAYLLPSNHDPNDILGTGLAFRDIVRMADLQAIKANQILFVLDACYAADALNLEGFRDDSEPSDALDKEYFRMLVSGRFVAGLTAGDRGQQVKEVNGHGIFTGVLTRGLLGEADVNGNGVIHFAELVTWLEPIVFRESKPHSQQVKVGRLPPGSGQMVFPVPPDSARQKILGSLEGGALSQEVRRRQAKLARMRGETDTPSFGKGESASGEGERVRKLEENIEQLKARLKQLEKTGQEAPIEKAQEKMQLEARLRTLDQTRQLKQEITGEDGAPMVLVPEGTFWMGSTSEEVEAVVKECVGYDFKEDECRGWVEREQPRHRVSLKAFYMDAHEVSNRLFEQFVKATGHQTTAEREGEAYAFVEGKGFELVKGASWRKPEGKEAVFVTNRADHPVVAVSWEDAQAYCEKYRKRLPTEAEWEYAARAGTATRNWWGNGPPGSRRVANIADESAKGLFENYLATYQDGFERTAPVGVMEANPWGLYDMIGNVAEWTADWYGEDFYSISGERNPTGPSTGTYRVLRGGSWLNVPFLTRSALRNRYAPALRYDFIGFRCVQGAP